MNEPTNRELIDHIADKLGQYEEPYVIGSWESFNKIRRKRRWFISISDSYGMVASFGVILFLMILPYSLRDAKKIAVVKNTIHNALADVTVKPVINNVQNYIALTVEASDTALYKTTQRRTRVFRLIKEKDYTLVFKKLQFNRTMDIPDTVSVAEAVEQDKETAPSKWNFAIGLSPAMSSTSKINVGGGLFIEYSLTPILSIRSGLSVNNYSTSTAVVDQPSSKRLTSVDASISTVDLPIELMVLINKNIYVSTGISSVALWRQSVNYNYNVESKVMLQAGTGANGEIILTEATVTQNKTEAASQDTFSRLALVGFYNFNVGYRYSLVRDRQLMVEPFVKIPAAALNTDNIKFTMGGVTLKYKF